MLLTLGACGSQAPSPSVATASPAEVSIEPSQVAPSPTASASLVPANLAPIAVDSIALVVTNDLLVRSKPGVSEASRKLSPLLDADREVYVVAGPVAASGYTWYQVKPLTKPGEFVDLPFGWVAAASKDGEPWLAGGPVACPAKPSDYASFIAIRPLVGLACFSDDDLTFDARLGSPEATCGVSMGWTIEPEWLAGTCPHPKFLLADLVTTSSTDAVIDPDLDVTDRHAGVEPKDWLKVNVTGHFDDAAARNCRGVSQEIKVPLTPEEVVLTCRQQFVVISIELYGP